MAERKGREQISAQDSYRYFTPSKGVHSRGVDGYERVYEGDDADHLLQAIRHFKNAADVGGQIHQVVSEEEGARKFNAGEDLEGDESYHTIRAYERMEGRAEYSKYVTDIQEFVERNQQMAPDEFEPKLRQIRARYMAGRSDHFNEGFAELSAAAEEKTFSVYKTAQLKIVQGKELDNMTAIVNQALDMGNDPQSIRQMHSFFHKEGARIGLSRDQINERLAHAIGVRMVEEGDPDLDAYGDIKDSSGIRLKDTGEIGQILAGYRKAAITAAKQSEAEEEKLRQKANDEYVKGFREKLYDIVDGKGGSLAAMERDLEENSDKMTVSEYDANRRMISQIRTGDLSTAGDLAVRDGFIKRLYNGMPGDDPTAEEINRAYSDGQLGHKEWESLLKQRLQFESNGYNHIPEYRQAIDQINTIFPVPSKARGAGIEATASGFGGGGDGSDITNYQELARQSFTKRLYSENITDPLEIQRVANEEIEKWRKLAPQYAGKSEMDLMLQEVNNAAARGIKLDKESLLYRMRIVTGDWDFSMEQLDELSGRAMAQKKQEEEAKAAPKPAAAPPQSAAGKPVEKADLQAKSLFDMVSGALSSAWEPAKKGPEQIEEMRQRNKEVEQAWIEYVKQQNGGAISEEEKAFIHKEFTLPQDRLIENLTRVKVYPTEPDPDAGLISANDRKEIAERFRRMTENISANLEGDFYEKAWGSFTPEERMTIFKAFDYDPDERKKAYLALTPEERKIVFGSIKSELQKAWESLTPEERDIVAPHLKTQGEGMKKIIDGLRPEFARAWDSLSDEDRKIVLGQIKQ